ncbi:hypothetical protein M8J75_010107 [Diaphorina citri]|nr:hypothetical protein M8J75_010107 [Diaphorina citri]
MLSVHVEVDLCRWQSLSSISSSSSSSPSPLIRRSSSPPPQRYKPRVEVGSWTDNAEVGGLRGSNLPSVKKLAAQYMTSQESLVEKPPEVTRVSPPKCLNILTKSSPMKQVHSLTARSISKEFREGLKLQKPSVLNKNNLLACTEPKLEPRELQIINDLEDNLKVTPRSEKDDVSDDSGTASPTVQFYEDKLSFWEMKTSR